MTQLTIGPRGEIMLGQGLLDHVGLPAGGKLVAKKLPDGTVVLHPQKATKRTQRKSTQKKRRRAGK